MKNPKKKRHQEEKTVFVLTCDGHYALTKRPDQGLLASLWQFPDTPGILETAQAVAWAEERGLLPKEIFRQKEYKHIFTHVEWKMRGIFMEVRNMGGGFVWMDGATLEAEAALPTAYRQLWEDVTHV